MRFFGRGISPTYCREGDGRQQHKCQSTYLFQHNKGRCNKARGRKKERGEERWEVRIIIVATRTSWRYSATASTWEGTYDLSGSGHSSGIRGNPYLSPDHPRAEDDFVAESLDEPENYLYIG